MSFPRATLISHIRLLRPHLVFTRLLLEQPVLRRHSIYLLLPTADSEFSDGLSPARNDHSNGLSPARSRSQEGAGARGALTEPIWIF